MLNPVIYSFTIKEFKKSAIRLILPLWRLLHRLCKFIPAPDDHYGLRMSRQGAKARFRSLVSSKFGPPHKRAFNQNPNLYRQHPTHVQIASHNRITEADEEEVTYTRSNLTRTYGGANDSGSDKRKPSENDITCIMLTKRDSNEHNKSSKSLKMRVKWSHEDKVIGRNNNTLRETASTSAFTSTKAESDAREASI